jgi:hypothetical protein
MFMMKNEVVVWPSVVSDDLVDQRFVNDSTSQFQKFHVNFHKFHSLFSVRLLLSSEVLLKMGCKNAHSCEQNQGFSFDFYHVIPQRWR